MTILVFTAPLLTNTLRVLHNSIDTMGEGGGGGGGRGDEVNNAMKSIMRMMCTTYLVDLGTLIIVMHVLRWQRGPQSSSLWVGQVSESGRLRDDF